MRMLNVSTLWGTIAVSASQGTQEMVTTVQVSFIFGIECKVFFYTITADINECETLNETCSDENAECVNTVGNYSCQCKPGYTGDGYNCAGLSGRMDL